MLQFETALSSNIRAVTNSSVRVSITSITDDANASSVTMVTNVAILNAQRSSAQLYVSVLTGSNAAAIFGTAFTAVTVDVASIGTTYVFPAGEPVLIAHHACCCYGKLSALWMYNSTPCQACYVRGISDICCKVCIIPPCTYRCMHHQCYSPTSHKASPLART